MVLLVVAMLSDANLMTVGQQLVQIIHIWVRRCDWHSWFYRCYFCCLQLVIWRFYQHKYYTVMCGVKCCCRLFCVFSRVVSSFRIFRIFRCLIISYFAYVLLLPQLCSVGWDGRHVSHSIEVQSRWVTVVVYNCRASARGAASTPWTRTLDCMSSVGLASLR